MRVSTICFIFADTAFLLDGAEYCITVITVKIMRYTENHNKVDDIADSAFVMFSREILSRIEKKIKSRYFSFK